ncbi:hypothetical protein BIT28_10750 [Photobacterium proteolyticum]|uniref:Phage coat protein n=1 Tax=Photobacterium proteolyticum TaxID=1903952 RepID=A0A1Q9G6U6_9GAMM|nr:hypothetical protein [Photobacterium proteolyticum]OLQ70014.1 hypothetical protein BIT28_10750 [Photobacterium proteolyticum]
MKYITLKRKFGQVALVTTSAVMAAPSFAEDSATVTAIKSAVAAGQSSVQVTVAGVIGLAALGFGVGMIISYLRR